MGGGVRLRITSEAPPHPSVGGCPSSRSSRPPYNRHPNVQKGRTEYWERDCSYQCRLTGHCRENKAIQLLSNTPGISSCSYGAKLNWLNRQTRVISHTGEHHISWLTVLINQHKRCKTLALEGFQFGY